MQARGISKEAGKHLIAIGFCKELLDRFDQAEVTEVLLKRIVEKYARSEALVLDDKAGKAADSVQQDPTNVRELQGTL
jgi:hypothetical protein